MTAKLWKQHFISATELHSLDAAPIIIDCRFELMTPENGKKSYLESHIPAAHYFDLNQDLSSAVKQHGGRHPFPDLDHFVEKLRSVGVNQDSLIVAYDDQRFAFASRLWYLCRYIGYTQIKLLDGGFSAWKNAGLPVTQALPREVARGNISAHVQADWLVDFDRVKTLSEAAHPHVNLIDSREEARYLGLQEPIDPIAGHIPSAENLPWITAVDANGHFLSAEEQAKRWDRFSVNEKETIVYCGSGVTACVNMLSLATLGIESAKLYAGSWSDWCSYHV
ncbi:MAG TPA: sulfurtransferase [Pseudomonadales bacterium]|nr:sulfurtransferase [Pseudomonadales bacterium]